MCREGIFCKSVNSEWCFVQVLLLSGGILLILPHLWRFLRIKSQSCFSGIRHLQRSEIISRLSGVGLSGPLVHSFNLFQRQQPLWRYTWFSLLSLVLVEHPSRRHWRPFVGCMSKRIRWTLLVHPVIGQLKAALLRFLSRPTDHRLPLLPHQYSCIMSA